jgi:hypothetical protein
MATGVDKVRSVVGSVINAAYPATNLVLWRLQRAELELDRLVNEYPSLEAAEALRLMRACERLCGELQQRVRELEPLEKGASSEP